MTAAVTRSIRIDGDVWAKVYPDMSAESLSVHEMLIWPDELTLAVNTGAAGAPRVNRYAIGEYAEYVPSAYCTRTRY